jgi:hypothetical protein
MLSQSYSLKAGEILLCDLTNSPLFELTHLNTYICCEVMNHKMQWPVICQFATE